MQISKKYELVKGKLILTNYLHGKALWQQVATITDSALACGALESIPTHSEMREVYCAETTISFQVRVVENLRRKSSAVQQRARQAPNAKNFNPFLPYEPALYVGELTDHYRCLLNKFNVVDHHLLMVTNQFVPQKTPLDTEDFLAAQRCLEAHDGLVFYNGGSAAGASVEHKHLQMIPLPLSAECSFPFDGLLSLSAVANQPVSTGLPFSHRVVATEFTETTSTTEFNKAAETNCNNYHRLLTELNISANNHGLMSSHNMLMTRKFIWVIPRSKESYQGLSVNALGFAGMLLVKNEAQLKQLDEVGCLELLKAVSL